MSLRTVLFCFKDYIIPDIFIYCLSQKVYTIDLGVHCFLRYTSVPIFGVNTGSYLAACVKNTTIYLFKYIVVIKNSVASGQLYA